MSATDAFETALLQHIYQNAAIANIGDATGLRGSTAAGSLYAALFTAIPAETGGGTETTYSGYARQAIARTSGGFTVAGNQVSNAAAVAFPACTGGATQELVGFAIMTAATGGDMLMRGFLRSGSWLFTAKADDTVTVPGHSCAVGDRVALLGILGASLPGGTTDSTTLYVKTVSGNDLTLSTTSGGATLDLTSVGTGALVLLSPLQVSLNITPNFAIGAFIGGAD